ncbi:hypothetical protein PGB28_14205 [Primorskyibacter aestuariivivens]|uniref:hypothetical protein n=1 Tax=Primorskyibacter aestuariivivens TaxID=1888912 RepID=UPI0023019BF8|nr:hypothetical protein [Primorskyibacter aestuariivivens]MDA7429619.1 hypothetical protein [Primorskyibacter aestuariivivens]
MIGRDNRHGPKIFVLVLDGDALPDALTALGASLATRADPADLAVMASPLEGLARRLLSLAPESEPEQALTHWQRDAEAARVTLEAAPDLPFITRECLSQDPQTALQTICPNWTISVPWDRSGVISSAPLPLGLAALLIAQNEECQTLADWLLARAEAPNEQRLNLGFGAAMSDWRKLCEMLQRAQMEEALARAGQKAAECRAARAEATAKTRETALARALLDGNPPLPVPGEQADGSNRTPFWQRLGQRAQKGES